MYFHPESQREPIVILQAHHSLQAIGTLVRGYDYESGLKFLPDVVVKLTMPLKLF